MQSSILTLLFTFHVVAATVYQHLLIAARETSTMTGMALDCQQHHTRTTLTTSLGKTGSQKHSLLDVQSPNDENSYDMTSSYQQNDFSTIFSNAFLNNPPNDILPRFNIEYIPHTLPPSLLIPATFPSEGSVVQKNSKVEEIAQPMSMP